MRMITNRLFKAMTALCALGVVAASQVLGQPATQSNDKTTEKTKPCFSCNKTGTTKCSVATCRNGMAECPGPCLKLTKGTWIKRDVPGHTDPTERWQAKRVGKQTWFFSSKHVGEYYTFDASGQPVAHACNVCGGSTAVNCKACSGKGTITCPTCEGKKTVPESWIAFDNPKMKNRPSRFQLKDGRVLIGHKTTVLGTSITIRALRLSAARLSRASPRTHSCSTESR